MSEKAGNGMTRRQFGRATAAAAAGFSVLASRSGIAATNSDTLKVGLLGCGGRGRGAAVNHLQGCDNVKLVAMADIFEDQLQSARKMIESIEDPKVQPKVAIDNDLCFVGVDAYKKLLATDIDILIHGTTPYIRPVHIAAAVEAGKHIFTEKPIATDAPGVRLFLEASKKAKEKGLSLVAGTQRRHQKVYLDEMERIHGGEYGELLAGRAYWCGTLPFARDRKEGMSDLEYRLRNWYSYCWVCGDNIVEQHIHNLDVINWAFQAHPARVFASGGRTWKPSTEKYGDIYDHFSCDYEYPNGAHVISMSRHWNNSDGGVFEEVTGTKGKSSCRAGGKDPVNPYVQEHTDLVASIRGEGPYLNEGIRVAESCLTAIMGRMSAYRGKVITWEDAMKDEERLVPEKLDFALEYPVRPVPVPGS